MLNQANQSPDREYKVYIPSTHQFIPVAKEFYYEYYRPIWHTQKEAQKHDQCMCPRSKLWRCDGCCLDCPKPTLVPESDKRPVMNTAKSDFMEENDYE